MKKKKIVLTVGAVVAAVAVIAVTGSGIRRQMRVREGQVSYNVSDAGK